ncbi:MAG TPA: AMP-binding protein [Acidimicrobiales bacterium]|jgi:fatty-acyl-CoA synthase|nr:AMP-binding protein [Acidimicrobiales bacterium]
MPAPNAAALLRRNASDPDISLRPAVRFGERVWTHHEYVAECRRWANLFISRRPPGRPFHVGVLLDNVPDYLFALGGAALAGATIVGLNHTRRGQGLQRDIAHTDVAMIVTEPRHEPLLEPIVDGLGLTEGNLLVSRRFADPGDPEPRLGGSLDEALADVGVGDPDVDDPSPDSIWALVFTSGTSDAPKAVICSQRRIMVTGNRMGMMLGLGPDDVGYVSMPLFHSNAVMVGWAPSIVYGGSVGLARRFSASRWLQDVRRYGATYFNYTGKPLSYILDTPARPDDADNSLRIAFGNEGSPQVVEAFGSRFGVEVVDAFGATEGGVAVNREPGMPQGAMGRVGEAVKVVDEEGGFRPAARFDTSGRLVNAEECVGEIVSTAGSGPFEGYYNNADANARATRRGWYWSGDLGYVDDEGYLYFAGRTAEWIRVDGENFPAGPIESALSRHPDVVVAAAYGVPDEQAGDQVMACLVLREGARAEGAAIAAWIDAQGDVAPKWRPRFLRVTEAMPTTATNKIVKRTLVHQKFRSDRTGGDPIFVRGRGEPAYRLLTAEDERRLEASFTAAGRQRFWDL